MSVLIQLVSLISLISLGASFTVTPKQRSVPLMCDGTLPLRTSAIWVLNAMVFYPEGDDDKSLNDESPLSCDVSAKMLNRHKDLAHKLSSNQTILAHLASAFSPAGHSIKLENINSVVCTSLDNKHLDIEAILCDDSDCHSILVPVDYPNECPWDGDEDLLGFENCVMTNVEELDHDWEKRLPKDETCDVLLSATKLLQDAPVDFPKWWIPASTREDVAECELLRDLLNEDDMLYERVGLVQKADTTCSPLNSTGIESVTVLAVSPKGLLLKVATGETDGSIIPVQFVKGKCSIREKTLDLLSSASVN